MATQEIKNVWKQNVTAAEPVVSGGYRLELEDTMTMDLLTTPESDE